jgi:hypothetical protein
MLEIVPCHTPVAFEQLLASVHEPNCWCRTIHLCHSRSLRRGSRAESSRAYDAIQLACALALREDVLAVQHQVAEPHDFLFVSADLVLLTIARAEGFGSENPNNYA